MSCELSFRVHSTGELLESRFLAPDLRVFHCVRGKTAGAFKGSGTFQWSRAVRALVALVVRSALSTKDPACLPSISGGKDTQASALDYAVSKGPIWLLDMFGPTASGDHLAKRLFRRSNPNRKRPGPVGVSINPLLLPYSKVTIIIDDTVAPSDTALWELLSLVEETNVQSLAVRAC